MALPAAATTTVAQGRTFTDGRSASELDIRLPVGYNGHAGFLPVALSASNNGAAPARWSVMISESEGYGGQTRISPRNETLVVPPGQTVSRALLVPVRKQTSGWANLTVNVTDPSGNVTGWNQSISNNNTDTAHANVPVLAGPIAAAAVENMPPANAENMHGWLDPTLAPGDWRGYSCYPVVLLHESDWNQLPPAARSALGDWTRMGGHLQFLGKLPPDAPLPDNPGNPARGLGGVHPPLEDAEKKPDIKKLAAVITATRATGMIANATDSGESMMNDWLKGDRAKLLRERFRVWPMVLVLLGFFVMVAPVNLFVLAPSRRRHRMFFTVPALSLAACVLLGLAVLLGDGTGGRGERLIWIESRPGAENRLFITQWQASRCGALFGSGFTVPDAALFLPMKPAIGTAGLHVGGDSLQGGGGWFSSRTTQANFLQTARPGRGRLEWAARDGQAPAIVSTFDFPLRDVYVTPDGETWWHVPKVTQGETAQLERIEAIVVEKALASLLEHMPPERVITAMAKRPGHFIAFTDQPPAIETLRAIRWRDTGVVTGALSGAPAVPAAP